MESGDEDDLAMASREWDRMIANAHKTGYREGATDQTQKAFDLGYEWGMMHGMKVGKLLGFIESMIKNDPENNANKLQPLLGKVKDHAAAIDALKLTSDDINDEGQINNRSGPIEKIDTELNNLAIELKSMCPENSKFLEDMIMTVAPSKPDEKNVQKSSENKKDLSW